jgi:exosome complex exonuclease DIS3/RRP44
MVCVGVGCDAPLQVAPGEHMDEGAAGSGGTKQPTGRVVAILKRNWRSRGGAGCM